MVFSSAIFLFAFLPVAIGGYFIIHPKLRNIWLLLVSLFFYSWGEPKYVLLMIASILINYVIGIGIGCSKRQPVRVILLISSILYNLGVLAWFKYLGFMVSTFDRVFHTELVAAHSWVMDIQMPIGISFFTFQILSYVIDVYRKEVEAQKNVLKLGLYISLFPQLIAGPIVRYIDVAKQIDNRVVSFDGIYAGTLRFVIGFTKKVLFSNVLAQVAALAFDDKYAIGSMAMAWMGIVCYTLQIYFDFSGYSDMAIGLGKIFGFDFLENFNYPYISTSIKEFWRRWHISLSSWFRDYLYIPLGGSRKGKIRTYCNLLIIFFVTGLWHGASFNFIVWGLFHGAFLILERLPFGQWLEKWPKVIRHLYTMFVVMIGWVFFRAESLTDALIYIKNLFCITAWNGDVVLARVNMEMVVIMIFAIIFSMPILCKVQNKINSLEKRRALCNCVFLSVILAGFVLSICYMTGSGFNPFIYFRF